IGQISHFPYAMYANGGGAFLIPYFIAIFVVVLPGTYLEMVIGHLTERGPIRAWSKLSSAFKVTFAVNIDTMLRFPHYCMYYGGGAFFIPYFLAMIILGVFSVYLETLIGQITKLGPLQAWNKLLPPMKGLGFLYCLFGLFTMAYYFANMSYALYYFYLVNANTFNISTCNNTWNSPNCTVSYNFSCFTSKIYTPYSNSLLWSIICIFLRNYAFEGTPAPNQLGSLIPSLVACSLIAWLITFVIMLVGLRSLRFFGFLLVILSFAFIIMMIIVIQDLDGARDGILYLVTPHYSYLLQPSTWAIAGLHAIWTLSVGYGTYAHFGYRNKANTNPFWYKNIRFTTIHYY
ncbi:uncharacterized protein TRIADDRAFT_22904, partial [Trichoplax adhaerens]